MSAFAADLLPILPYHPYATDSLKSGCRIFSREYAVRKKYIQVNNPGQVVFLVFDLDYEGAALAPADLGLPEPTYTVINAENGHAHIFYRLKSPVTITERGREKPKAYLRAVKAAYTRKLGADPGFRGPLCKNPASPHWRVIDNGSVAYELTELAEYVDLDAAPSTRHDEDVNDIGRNVTLFDRLRLWAYQAVRSYWQPGQPSLYPQWMKYVLEKARSLNNYNGLIFFGQNPKKGLPSNAPLDDGEVASIARNVARWVWEKFTPGALDVLIERTHSSKLQAKRRAARTAQQHTIMIRGLELLTEGRTTTDVARECEVTTRTVRRWKAIKKTEEQKPEQNKTPTKGIAKADLTPDIGHVRQTESNTESDLSFTENTHTSGVRSLAEVIKKERDLSIFKVVRSLIHGLFRGFSPDGRDPPP